MSNQRLASAASLARAPRQIRIDFCPPHRSKQGAIAVTLIRMDQLKQAIIDRDWTQTEFQFDRVLRSLTKQLHETNH